MGSGLSVYRCRAFFRCCEFEGALSGLILIPCLDVEFNFVLFGFCSGIEYRVLNIRYCKFSNTEYMYMNMITIALSLHHGFMHVSGTIFIFPFLLFADAYSMINKGCPGRERKKENSHLDSGFWILDSGKDQ